MRARCHCHAAGSGSPGRIACHQVARQECWVAITGRPVGRSPSAGAVEMDEIDLLALGQREQPLAQRRELALAVRHASRGRPSSDLRAAARRSLPPRRAAPRWAAARRPPGPPRRRHRRKPPASSRLYCHTPPTQSATSRTRRGELRAGSRASAGALQLPERQRPLLLDVAERVERARGSSDARAPTPARPADRSARGSRASRDRGTAAPDRSPRRPAPRSRSRQLSSRA